MKILLKGILILLFFTVSAYAQSDDSSKWLVRARGIYVSPDVGDDLDGANVNISNAIVPELDFTYFFTKNIAAELILATTKHDVDVRAEGNKTDLGNVWLLPPTLSLQYHFFAGKIKPYVGAGVNYTFFYGIDEGDVLDMEYDNAFGFALQGGVDYDLNDKWFLNFDIKKLFLSTEATVSVPGIEPHENKAATAIAVDKINVEVDINPLIIGFGVGYRLNW